MSAQMITYYLDELKGGAGPGNRGDNFAKFRHYAGLGTGGHGTFEMYTSDWIKRGRPTQIDIALPEEVGGERG